MKEAAEENTFLSLVTLRAAVYATTGEEIPKSTMHTWVRGMGFKHGKKKLSGLSPAYTNVLVRRYLLQYTKMLKAEKRKRVVLVWMDESYIHQGYCSGYTWSHPTNTVTSGRTQGNESGKRLIIIGAITKDGILEDEDGEEPSDNLIDECPSATVVTSKLSEGGVEPEDYHDTMNGKKFLAWVENRLFPAFKKKYDKKKMVLILDNASFHKSRDETWKSVTGKDREWLQDYLFKAQVLEITGKDGRKIPSIKFTLKKNEGGCTDAELREVVKDHIKSHWSNSTVLEQLFKKEGYELLWTPQYESWLQPIELVWARVKHEVARQSRRGRKWQETEDQTKEALKKIDKTLCTSIIEHTHKLMNEWLTSDDAGVLQLEEEVPSGLKRLIALSVKQRAEYANLFSKVDVEVALEEAAKEN
jgi:transposase